MFGFTFHAIWGNIEEIKYTIINGFVIGFFVGLFELIFSNPKVERLPYSVLLFLRTIAYFSISLVSVFILIIIYLKSLGLSSASLADPNKFEEIKKVYFLTNINTIYLLIFILLASFLWQLKSFLGKGVLFNYLTGKYHKPTIEERIFMFLDLNDATTLAEKLDSEKYSSLLSDFFNDIDLAITKTKGQVFQYVGDEVVVLWKTKHGLKNNNCIKSYLLALDILQNKKKYYQEKYEILPSFKAALHLGKITITEIGASKREIVYHGDTINTASRLCSSAHRLGKRILISKALHDRLTTDTDIKFEDLGVHTLKGKDEKIQIYGV